MYLCSYCAHVSLQIVLEQLNIMNLVFNGLSITPSQSNALRSQVLITLTMTF